MDHKNVAECLLFLAKAAFASVFRAPAYDGHPPEARFLDDLRIFVLGQLKKSPFVNRKAILESSKMPPDLVSCVLAELCRLKHGQGWQLKLDPDIDFVSRFQNIALSYEHCICIFSIYVHAHVLFALCLV